MFQRLFPTQNLIFKLQVKELVQELAIARSRLHPRRHQIIPGHERLRRQPGLRLGEHRQIVSNHDAEVGATCVYKAQGLTELGA